MKKNQITNEKITLSVGILVSILCVLFGSGAVAIKISLDGYGKFTALFIRMSIAMLTMLIWAILTHRPLLFKKGQLHQLIIKTLFLSVEQVTLFLGFALTTASRGTLMMNVQPFFVLFLAHLFIPGDRITFRKAFGIALGFLGVFFVVFDKNTISSGFLLGDALLLIGALSWACNAVYTKHLIVDYEPFHLIFYPMLFAMPLFLVEVILFDEIHFIGVNWINTLSLVYQGIFVVAMGYIVWIKLYQRYAPVSLHSFVFLIPVSGVFLGGVVLGEPLTIKIILALILIVCGILVVQVQKSQSDTGLSKKICRPSP